jgi:hypothetical protein
VPVQEEPLRRVSVSKKPWKRRQTAADAVSQDYSLEPTRSILHRSAASIALRIGDVQEAQHYSEFGLTDKTPIYVKEELHTLQEQILVLEAATNDYRLRGPRGPTLIEQISRKFRSTAPINITGPAKALGLAGAKQTWVRMLRVRYSLIFIEAVFAVSQSE